MKGIKGIVVFSDILFQGLNFLIGGVPVGKQMGRVD